VINDEGMGNDQRCGRGSQWIVDHHNKYNIRVVNFSLHAITPSHFVNDPLDKGRRESSGSRVSSS